VRLIVTGRDTSEHWAIMQRDALPEVRGSWALSPASARFSAENWFWGFCLLSALTILIPFEFMHMVSELDFGPPIALALLSTAYSGVHLTLLAISGHKKLFSLTFWVFSYVWLGLVPLVQLATKDYPWPSGYDDGVTAYALLIILVGYGAYDIGSWLGRLCYYKYGGRLIPYSFSLSKRRAYLLSLFAIVASLIAIQQLGGANAIVGATRYSLDQAFDPEASKAASLIWGTLLRVPAYIALLTLWWIWLNRQQLLTRRWQKVSHLAFLLLLLVLNLTVNNPISLNRFFLGTIIFSFVAISLSWNERRSFSVWVVCLVFLLVVIFPYSDVFREESQSLNFAPVTTQLASNGDYDAFQQIVNTVVYVSADGITYGQQLLGALLFWVPRVVWPGKPVGSGQFVAEHIGYDFTNLSSPLWAEAYINAGLIGVVAILLLFGLVTSLLQQGYIASTKARGLLFIGGLVPILAGFQFFFLRGDLQNGIAYMVPMLGCYLLTAKVTRAPSRTRRYHND
jgi:oligosaccharide repeat unit polymerase